MIPPSTPQAAAKITWKTITPDIAKRAIKTYNEGVNGCIKNPHVDDQARDMFRHGLGLTREDIERQVELIGHPSYYGGVAGFPAALSLAETIADDIYNSRKEYEQAAVSALPLLDEIPHSEKLKTIYRPFTKPFHTKRGTKSNWLIWASKFWHFLNHNAFPIRDRRVRDFFQLKDNESSAIDRYLTQCKVFREFALSHREWLTELWEVDDKVNQRDAACCENKLWDKMCYGVEDLNRKRA